MPVPSIEETTPPMPAGEPRSTPETNDPFLAPNAVVAAPRTEEPTAVFRPDNVGETAAPAGTPTSPDAPAAGEASPFATATGTPTTGATEPESTPTSGAPTTVEPGEPGESVAPTTPVEPSPTEPTGTAPSVGEDTATGDVASSVVTPESAPATAPENEGDDNGNGGAPVEPQPEPSPTAGQGQPTQPGTPEIPENTDDAVNAEVPGGSGSQQGSGWSWNRFWPWSW